MMVTSMYGNISQRTNIQKSRHLSGKHLIEQVSNYHKMQNLALEYMTVKKLSHIGIAIGIAMLIIRLQ